MVVEHETITRLRSPQARAKLKSAQVQCTNANGEYVGADGLTAREIKEELQKFSDRLHEYSQSLEEVNWEPPLPPFDNPFAGLFNQ